MVIIDDPQTERPYAFATRRGDRPGWRLFLLGRPIAGISDTAAGAEASLDRLLRIASLEERRRWRAKPC